MRQRDVLGLGISLLVPPPAWALGPVDKLWEQNFRKFVEDELANTETPNLGVAMIRDGQTVFAEGYKNKNYNTKVNPNTAFHVASVSKLVTGAAMMMLWEQHQPNSPTRLFELDDPIKNYLDFPLADPYSRQTQITFRHLFNHTSGISDEQYLNYQDPAKPDPGFQVCGDPNPTGDPTILLRDFLMGYLTPTGTYYDKQQSIQHRSFSNSNPGTTYDYSNVGIALLGYLAGLIPKNGPKIPLKDLTKQKLFTPLGLTNTAWRIQDVPKDLATPYGYDKNGNVAPLPCQTGYPDWPAGMLRSSPRDFARFLAIFTNKGVVDNKSYMEDATVREFLTAKPGAPLTPSGKRQGLIWQIDNSGVASHDGCDDGALTLVSVDPQNRTAALAFANFKGCGCDYCNNCNNCTNPVAVFLTDAVKQLLAKAQSLTP